MTPEFRFDLEPELRPGLRVSPRLVAANNLLALSAQELEQAVAAELEANPALERVETPLCPVCSTELVGSICPRCIQRQKQEELPTDWHDFSYEGGRVASAESDGQELDPLSLVAAEETLADRLLAELGALLPEEDRPIAEYLVGSLDDRGYLTTSVDEVAFELDVDARRVRRALQLLQSLEPAGIGARNLRECLLLQIEALESRGIAQPHVREIVRYHLEDLGARKLNRIARELQVPLETVEEAWQFVRERLNPSPAHGRSALHSSERESRQVFLIPDVVITRGENGYEVEVVESKRLKLRVSPIYRELRAELRRPDVDLSPEERQHIREHVERAERFIANLTRRGQTLLKITRCVAELQSEFLEKGVRYLKPLARIEVAARLGFHESTVSRATAGKSVMLPSGAVVPFSDFFTPSLPVKDVIKELIRNERRPLTDAEVAERLRQRGVRRARRTIAKYRAQLAILPSSLR